MPSQADLVQLAKQAALDAGIDPALVCAVVEQESGWNPWSMRYEPAFYTRYIAPMQNNTAPQSTESVARSTSWGLMQLMGETARELGFSTASMVALCDPATGLAWGCRLLKKKLTGAKGDNVKALLAWNGGSNKQYPSQVLARIGKYASS